MIKIEKGLREEDLDKEAILNWLKNENVLLKNTFSRISLSCHREEVFDGRFITVIHNSNTIWFDIKRKDRRDSQYAFDIGYFESIKHAKKMLSRFVKADTPEKIINLFEKREMYSSLYFHSDIKVLENTLKIGGLK